MPKNRSKQPAKMRTPRERKVRIRSELRRRPDLNKIAHTVIALAMAQAQAEKEAMGAGGNGEVAS